MIVRWEGTIEAGTTSPHISAFWDFLPTASDLAGTEPPEGIDGISFLPELLGSEQTAHTSLYWEFLERGGAMAIRRGDWKLVRNQVISEPPGTLELYNLAEDPGESEDVAARYPDLVEELLEEMENSRVESPAFPLLSSGE